MTEGRHSILQPLKLVRALRSKDAYRPHSMGNPYAKFPSPLIELSEMCLQESVRTYGNLGRISIRSGLVYIDSHTSIATQNDGYFPSVIGM